MEYDFRTSRTGGSSPSPSPYESSYIRPPTTSSGLGMYGGGGQSQTALSMYPRVGGPTASHSHGHGHGRNHPPPFHHAPPPPPPSASTSSGLGIRVAIKPEYRITPPPPLLPHLGEIPRSNFHFDFEFERNVLTEAVKENPNWSRLGIENTPPKATETTSSYGRTPAADPVVSKYIAAGLSRDAVPLAVANYGDNPTKVKEFANGYALLREMGFSSNNVAEALLMYDNDTDKALAHFLNNAS